jgi:uncharacterized protein (DUF58 family)
MESVPRASDPSLLASLARLELRARTAVEGLAGGRHRSAAFGASTTFAQHREYVPGDDLRHLDWKLIARTERDIVRQYEEETDLTGYLVLDASASMQYSSQQWSKHDYATWIAAAVAHLLKLQNDKTALAITRGDQVIEWIPARRGEAHYQNLLEVLENLEPGGAGDPADGLAEAIGQMERRGLVVWISDCLGEPSAALQAASQLRHDRHDLITLRVLDPAEIDFPFGRHTRFEALEGSDHLMLEPRAVREAYLAEFEAHGAELRRGLRALRTDFRRLPTDEALDVGLTSFLSARDARLRRSRR